MAKTDDLPDTGTDDDEEAGGRNRPDPELYLLGRLNRALGELDEKSRLRIMTYLNDRHGRPQA